MDTGASLGGVQFSSSLNQAYPPASSFFVDSNLTPVLQVNGDPAAAPQLQISNLSPNSTTAGGLAFTLTVNGSGFVGGSAVQWNGTALSTNYLTGNQLSASVPANLIASQGSANVTVVNPGGATSNGLTFTINPPPLVTPLLSNLSPNSSAAGGSSFALTVNGSGFLGGSIVQWNGSALSTIYLSGNQLIASVPAHLIAFQGSANVTVVNPGGATSNGLTFSINAPTSGTPIITSLSPNSATPGGPAFTLTVNGSGFVNGAVVLWNSSPLSTTFLGTGSQLTAAVPGFLIANPGTANIAVLNPSGTGSNLVTFTVTSQLTFTNALRIAQIADGASWKTLLQVVNLDQVPVNYSFQFWDDNGNPLPLPFVNRLPGTFSGSLAVGGTAFAETPGISPTLFQGWAEVASSGRIGILTIFRQSVAGRPDSEGTVTGVQSGNRVVLPFDDTNGYVTGVAVANTNPTQTLFILLVAQTDTGATSTGSLVLPPHAHTTFVLTSMFPSLAGVRGSIQFSASTPDIAVVGLRFSPTNSFTSLGDFH